MIVRERGEGGEKERDHHLINCSNSHDREKLYSEIFKKRLSAAAINHTRRETAISAKHKEGIHNTTPSTEQH